MLYSAAEVILVVLTVCGQMRFWAPGLSGFSALCQVQVYEDEQRNPLMPVAVILTQLPYDISGRSITNCIEDIATQLAHMLRGLRGVKPDELLPIGWIVHYSPEISVLKREEFDHIQMKEYKPGFYSDPDWNLSITRQEVEEIIGEPFAPHALEAPG